MKRLSQVARKYSKYLIFLGLFLGTAGLVAGGISGVWSPIAIALLVGGVAIALVGAGLMGSQPDGFLQQRSTQAGTNGLVATLSVIVLLALLNFLAVRYSTRFDLSETQQFTLAQESQQLVAKLSKPLKVWVFASQPNPSNRELLENYRRQGSKFEFEFVDPTVQIGLVEKFGMQSPGEVYLEYGEKKQLIQTLRPPSEDRLDEGTLTAAIEQILSDRPARIYFLQGHGELSLAEGERGLSQAIAELEERGYETEPLNLAEQLEIPEDADAIVVAGAERSLFAAEVKTLQDYLDDGGSLLLAIDPKTEPKLEPLLKDWGVTLDPRLVIDGSGQGSLISLGPATPVVFTYGTHPITAQFGTEFSVYPLARPVDVKKIEGIQASPLLLTTEQTWAESDLETQELSFDSDRDRAGPLTLGVALSKSEDGSAAEASGDKKDKADKEDKADKADKEDKGEERAKKTKESRLIVFGNSSFAANGWFRQQLNGDVFLNSIKWLTKTNELTLSVRPKEPKNRRLFQTGISVGQINPQAAALPLLNILGLMTVLIVGLAFAAAGVLWWRRR